MVFGEALVVLKLASAKTGAGVVATAVASPEPELSLPHVIAEGFHTLHKGIELVEGFHKAGVIDFGVANGVAAQSWRGAVPESDVEVTEQESSIDMWRKELDEWWQDVTNSHLARCISRLRSS
eukprot:TRINITY_DN22957_c0_g3_i1.p1 TRINITY_DN22957_c0_g3~~TRINITY_DN22957_c0_g3_i1.p1  ORF type:complete len:123 (+),score=24.68 TRINITY_DN22957_c0_g3_i1:105-473(+)